MIKGTDNIHEALEKIAASGLSSAERSQQSQARRVRARKEAIRRLSNDPLAIRAPAYASQHKGYSGHADPVTLRLQRQAAAFKGTTGYENRPMTLEEIRKERDFYNKPQPATKARPARPYGAASTKETRLVEEVLKNTEPTGRMKGGSRQRALEVARVRSQTRLELHKFLQRLRPR